MQSRVKQIEKRIEQEISQKEGLLNDIETPVPLKIMPLTHEKKILVSAENYGFQYPGAKAPLFQNLNFTVQTGDRIILQGANGCGKSTLIQTLLHRLKKAPAQTSTPPGLPKTPPGRQKPPLPQNPAPTPSNPATPTPPTEWGTLRTASTLIVSYVSQDTSFLQGKLKTLIEKHNLPEPLFYALLRQLDLEREQFQKPMEEFSEGQRKSFNSRQPPHPRPPVHLGRAAKLYRYLFTNADRNPNPNLPPHHAHRRTRPKIRPNHSNKNPETLKKGTHIKIQKL